MKIKSYFQKFLSGKDVFSQTQNRLTLLYSGVLVLFLVLFIAVVYALLYNIIFTQQERQMKELAKREINVIQDEFIQKKKASRPGSVDENVIISNDSLLFYYVVGKNDEVLVGDESIRWMQSNLLETLRNWEPSKEEVRYTDVKVNLPEVGKERHIEFEKNRTMHIMMVGRPVYYENEVVGRLYIGKDVSVQQKIFQWVIFVLGGIGLLFFIVALAISHFLSKRTMIPIANAFARQREFVADASHELRTPLSVLLSSIDTLEMEETIEEDPFSRNVLGNMKDEVKRMANLIGDLLTLARSDSGTLEVRRDSFEFRTHADTIVKSLEPIAAAKNISLQFHAFSDIHLYADLEKLKQLLYILLDNAIKYTPNNGLVQLSLSTEGTEQNKMFIMQVRDTGVGIPPEDCDKVFDRFYRVDKSRARQMGGHGLGLSIAKWIVDAHQGTIHVTSKLNEGSTFIVRIPVK
ncbi:sensor histidine kinase [Ectobacillus funiculus]|uniref:sensor histidine kinase n=1 Tax=Ectobacillus funiculus TaxID=137993 RepID=UPI00101D1A48|nr:ATP-binding protein [Ectobacillus funiculus]